MRECRSVSIRIVVITLQLKYSEYQEELEEKNMFIMQKMMLSENQKVSTIAQETSMSEDILYKWKKEAKAEGIVILDGEPNAEQWNTQDEFQVVLETASLNEVKLAEYCRKNGLYVE